MHPLNLNLLAAAALTASLAASHTVTAADKQLLWGDTHLHTNYSSDAYANGNLAAEPDVAYRYARGIPVIHPYHRARVQIETPLDYLVVSDHVEFLGGIRSIHRDGVDTSELGVIDTIKAYVAHYVLSNAIDSGDVQSLFVSNMPDPDLTPLEDAEAASMFNSNGSLLPIPRYIEIDAWKRITDFADEYNEPGVFTALVGWEWSSIPGGANLHRVVISDSSGKIAQSYDPFGSDNSPYPEDLWSWLEETSAATGANFIAIPHNSNLSKGYMFDTQSLRGEEMTPEYARVRAKWEPIVEITQTKGDSETHPTLSPDDEFADFESYTYYIQRRRTEYKPQVGDFVQPALKRGLALEQSLGVNPYQVGVIGSTDAHTSLPSAEENNFHGKVATNSTPENNQKLPGDNDDWPNRAWDRSVSGLAAVWTDPGFDATQSAFYYLRVLQIPTARHSLLDAIALGMDSAEGHPDTIQERAYTSSIWYRPVINDSGPVGASG